MSKSPAQRPAKDALHQIAALPWRRVDGRLEVCLITTRETRRWTIPKGWPMKGRSDRAAARIEAEQEAGITGKAASKPIGAFTYWKRREDRFDLVRATVYPLEVKGVLPAWKEQTQRQVRWLSIEDAALAVDEPELTTLLNQFGARWP